MITNPMSWDFAGWTQKMRDVKEFALELVVFCSFLANFLPKIERFATRRGRSIYKWLLLNPIAFLSLNWSRVHSLKDKKNV